MPRRKPPIIPDALLDQSLGGGDPREALEGKDGLMDALKKAQPFRASRALR